MDRIHYDGDTFLPTLPEQDDLLVEVGYHFGATRLMPFVQDSRRDFDAEALPDDEKVQAGIGWMFRGHQGNLKLSWARLSVDGAEDRDEVWLSFQAFTF